MFWKESHCFSHLAKWTSVIHIINQYKCGSPVLFGKEGNTETGRLKDAFECCVEGQSGEVQNSSVLFDYVKREGRSTQQSHLASLESVRNGRNTSHLLPRLPFWVSLRRQAVSGRAAAARALSTAGLPGTGTVQLLCPAGSASTSEHGARHFSSSHCHPLLCLSTLPLKVIANA